MATTANAPRKGGASKLQVGIIAAVALGLVIVVIALALRPSGSRGGLTGAIVNGSPAAPDFTLIDQNGRQVSLHDSQGKVRAVTFLYTHCPDVCPLIASTLGQADRRLAAQQNQVELLSVSVDPQGDTPPAIHKFDDDRGLADLPNWHYLTGAPSQLAKVWTDWGGINANNPDGAKALTPDQLEHMSIVYLVDPQGHMRAALPANFTVDDFLQDVNALASVG
ncbi:MAG: SCO family protein [Chloroflexi bacterium]|nr:SCO family protein [Chloroflexota bacterium]